MIAAADGWALESQRAHVPFTPSGVTLSVYRCTTNKRFRVVFCPLSGPLCSLSIMVATQSRDDKVSPDDHNPSKNTVHYVFVC